MPMRAFVFLASVVAIVSASAAYAVAPNVSNISAAQRGGGSRLVDVYYDLADPDSSLLYVRLKISNDGGASWLIIPRTVSGASITIILSERFLLFNETWKVPSTGGLCSFMTKTHTIKATNTANNLGSRFRPKK